MMSLRDLDTDSLKELKRLLLNNPKYMLKILEVELSEGFCPACKKPRRISCHTSILGVPGNCSGL